MAYSGGYSDGYSGDDTEPQTAPPIITATANTPRWNITPTRLRWNAQPNQSRSPTQLQGSET